jgi:hypothetical protein
VSLVDVLPTITEWIGGDAGDGFDGRSLAGRLERGERLMERTLFSYSRAFSRKAKAAHPVLREAFPQDGYRGSAILGVRGRWDVVLRPAERGVEYQVFDRFSDPLHLDDLWPIHGGDPDVQSLVEEINEYRERFVSRAEAVDKPVTDEQREGLRALGYVE